LYRYNAVLRGGACEHCDDLVMNAAVQRSTGVGPVPVRSDQPPHVRLELPAPDGVSDRPGWYGPTGRRSRCTRWLMERFGTKYLFQRKPVSGKMGCYSN
jgi:hypothetical protein